MISALDDSGSIKVTSQPTDESEAVTSSIYECCVKIGKLPQQEVSDDVVFLITGVLIVRVLYFQLLLLNSPAEFSGYLHVLTSRSEDLQETDDSAR